MLMVDLMKPGNDLIRTAENAIEYTPTPPNFW